MSTTEQGNSLNVLDEWQAHWQLPQTIVDDLRYRLTNTARIETDIVPGMSEAAVQSRYFRAAAYDPTLMMWRNNVGACEDSKGRFIRYGLCNESERVNTAIKSADGIGIRRVLITQAHVGSVIGQFVSREFKKADWKMPATLDARTRAQLNWAVLVNAYGGDAAFYNGNN